MKTAHEPLSPFRQTRALQAALGAWADKDHPELKRRAAAWVASVRKGNKKRYRKTPDRPDVPGN